MRFARASTFTITFLIVFAVALADGCASSSGSKSQSTENGAVVTTYEDPSYAIRITYPGDWQEQSIPVLMRPKGTIIVLVAPSDVGGTRMPPTVSFVGQDISLSPETTVEQHLDSMQQQLIDKGTKQFGDFKLIDASPAMLANESARRVTYTGSRMGVSLKVMNVIAVHGGKQYGIAYSADPEIFDEHRAAVEKVIASVRWMK